MKELVVTIKMNLILRKYLQKGNHYNLTEYRQEKFH
jgi:hypothetical protein